MSLNKMFKKGSVSFRFFGFYLFELVVSAFRIAWDIITIKNYSKPGFIEIPLDAKSDLEIAVIANLITFSPGTMVVDLSDDRKTMRVHVMFLDDAESEIREIKSKLESRVLEMMR